MKMLRFTAKNTSEALEQVRESLGFDAVIMSNTKTVSGVEVLAAVDYDRDGGQQKAHARNDMSMHDANSNVDELQRNFDKIIAMLTRLMCQINCNNHDGISSIAAQICSFLTNFGIEQQLSHRISNHFRGYTDIQLAIQDALEYLKNELPIASDTILDDGGIYAFVGPTGNGKTTSIAKIAAWYVAQYGAENVAIINIDTHRVAAVEQLLIYGKMHDIAIFSVDSAPELEAVLGKLTHVKLILIDTPGFANHDQRLTEQLRMLTTTLFSVKLCLTLAANLDSAFIDDTLWLYGSYGATYLIMTKMDECPHVGRFISHLINYQIPLAYIMNGQDIPENFVPANGQYLLSLMLSQTDVTNSIAAGHELIKGTVDAEC